MRAARFSAVDVIGMDLPVGLLRDAREMVWPDVALVGGDGSQEARPSIIP
jgi:hypothetical protein